MSAPLDHSRENPEKMNTLRKDSDHRPVFFDSGSVNRAIVSEFLRDKKKKGPFPVQDTMMISGCVLVLVISLLSGPNAQTVRDTV